VKSRREQSGYLREGAHLRSLRGRSARTPHPPRIRPASGREIPRQAVTLALLEIARAHAIMPTARSEWLVNGIISLESNR